MLKEELIERSPVRIFEKSIHGGLRPGETGIIAAPSGIGKTSVLVQLALDKLLQGEKVIHVSFSQRRDHILSWYCDIFDEFTKKKNLANALEVKNDLLKNRALLNFSQDGVSCDQIIKSLKALIREGGFKASSVIIDGFDFSRAGRAPMETVKAASKELSVSFWYSCTVNGNEFDKKNRPLVLKDYLDLLDVIIVLEAYPDHVHLTASKDRDESRLEQFAVKLDPKTLLLL